MGGLRALTDVPFIALSASTPPTVQSEIIRSLQLLSPVVVSCDLNRPNIFFSASPIKSLSISLMTMFILSIIDSFGTCIHREIWMVYRGFW